MKKYNREKIGEEYTTTKGYKTKIVDGGTNPSYCTIKFLETGIEREAQYAAVKSGFVKMEGYEKLYGKDKVGEKHTTNEGYKIEVVAAGTKINHVIIEFKEPVKYRVEVQYSTVRIGNIRNSYKKIHFGVGYIGEGNYSTRSKAYVVWRNMLMRCYDEKNSGFVNYGANGVSVCEEWLNFNVFADWFEKNKIEDWQLDKDLLSSNEQKTYSPQTCCFLPREINVWIKEKKNKITGVSKEGKKWRADIATKYLGAFETEEKAYLAYLEAKRLKSWNLSKKYSEKIKIDKLELFLKIFSENKELKKMRKKIADSTKIKKKIVMKLI